jgi:hypothetical protein
MSGTLVHPDEPGKDGAGAAAGNSSWYWLPGGSYLAVRVIQDLLYHGLPARNPQSQIGIEIQLWAGQQVLVIGIRIGMAGGGDGVQWMHGRFVLVKKYIVRIDRGEQFAYHQTVDAYRTALCHCR